MNNGNRSSGGFPNYQIKMIIKNEVVMMERKGELNRFQSVHNMTIRTLNCTASRRRSPEWTNKLFP